MDSVEKGTSTSNSISDFFKKFEFFTRQKTKTASWDFQETVLKKTWFLEVFLVQCLIGRDDD